jgi:hypothetical protein
MTDVLAPSAIGPLGTDPAALPPRCPVCGAATVRRTARSGPRSGVDLWTCVEAPRCRGTLDIGGTFGRPGTWSAADATAITADGVLRPSRSATGRPAAVTTDVRDDDTPWWLTRGLPAAPPPVSPAPPPVDEDILRRLGLLEPVEPSEPTPATAHAQPADPAPSPAPALAMEAPPVVGAPPAFVPSPAVAPRPVAAPATAAVPPRPRRRNALCSAADAAARGSAATLDLARPPIQRIAARTVDLVLDVVHPTPPPTFVGGRDVAGASAQVEFEWRRSRHRRKMRAALPAVVAITLIGMAMGFALFVGRGFLLAGLGSVAVGALGLWAITRLPGDALAWGRDAVDQRRTADYLDELQAAGYVVLHDRLAPGLRTNIDHIAIGPAGVFVIETKNLRGKLTMTGDKLFVGERTRTGTLDATYRHALAVQLALSDRLNDLRTTVRPVLCVHRTMQVLLDNEVRGVRVVSGPQLARFVRRLPVALDGEMIQGLAALADSRLQPAIP